MKRLVFSFLFLAACLCGAVAQNDAMYVYRNDGVINAFLKADVDSMVCSRMDLDSLLHNGYVVQEVWTADSVYRIPLAVIDSISFVTPETVYQHGTVNITTEMREYVVSSDSLLLVFADYTPQMLLPTVGDKLVNTEASGGLNRGFLGKVTEIEKTPEGYKVKCAPIDITDAFECYYGISHGHQKQKMRGMSDGYYPLRFVWEPGKITVPIITNFGWEISYEPDGNLLIPSVKDAEFTVSLTPRLESRSYLIVNKDYGVNLSVDLYGDYTLEEYLSLAGSLTGGGDIKMFDEVLVPCPEILCDIAIEGGVFLKGKMQISTQQKWKQRYKSAFHWKYSSKGKNSLKNINDISNVENTHSGIVAVKGIFETGLYLNVGLAFVATHQLDLAELGLRVEGGVHFDGTALPYLSNKEDAMRSPDLYNMMKGHGVELSLYYGTSLEGKLFGWSANKDIPNFLGIPFGKKWVWKSCYYVPEFKNTNLRKDSDGNYFASMDILGNCGPTDIGFSLQNKESYHDRIDGYCVYDYNGPSASAYSTFYSKPSSGPVIVYPLVKFGDLEMIASPSTDISPLVNTGNVTNIEETFAIASGYVEGLEYSMTTDAGICYSTGDPILGNYVSSGSKNDGYFSVSLSELVSNTTYYYCAYAYFDGDYYCGEVSSFKTKEKTDPNPDPNPDPVDLTGWWNFTNDGIFAFDSFGINIDENLHSSGFFGVFTLQCSVHGKKITLRFHSPYTDVICSGTFNDDYTVATGYGSWPYNDCKWTLSR